MSEGEPIGSIADSSRADRGDPRVPPPADTGLDPDGQGDPHLSFAFCAERAVVDVDVDLGLVRVVQIADRPGRRPGPQPAERARPDRRGTAQGLGLALMEEIQVRDGVVRNPSFTDYLLPTILDMPPVVSELIEEPEPGVAVRGEGRGRAVHHRRAAGRGRRHPRRDRPRAEPDPGQARRPGRPGRSGAGRGVAGLAGGSRPAPGARVLRRRRRAAGAGRSGREGLNHRRAALSRARKGGR